MNIAIIGTGNVGGALAAAWAKKGHRIFLGVRDVNAFKGQDLLDLPGVSVHPIKVAVAAAEVILLSVPAMAAAETAKSLGDTNGKIIIDAMNVVMGRGPAGFSNTADAILANTEARDVVKCFNSTGFNNMENPRYGETAIDMFMAGSSVRGKEAAKHLALDAGFEACYDIGGNDKFQLLEQFAFFWINLAMMQGQGRDIAFKLLKR
jgi:predicted dinucleotide-binding enzyme